MKPLLAGGLALGLLSGCPGSETLWIPEPPDRGTARSAVVFFEWDDQRVVTAESLTESIDAIQFPALEWVDGPPPVVEMTVAYYDQGLADLALLEGRLTSTTTPRPCTANRPARVFGAELIAGIAAPWEQRTGLTLSQQAYLTTGQEACLRPSLCRPFRFDVLSLENDHGVNDLLAIDSNRLLVSQERGGITVLHLDGRLERPAEFVGLPSLSVTQRPDRTFFFGGARGQVARGPLEGPFVNETVAEPDMQIVALEAAPDDSGIVYALGTSRTTTTAAVLRYEDQQWSEMWRAVVDRTKAGQSEIVWMGPDYLLAVFGGQDLVRLQAGTVELINVSAASPIGGAVMNALGRYVAPDGRLNVFAGGSDSFVYRATSDDLRRWDIEGSAGFFGGVIGMGEADGGLILGGEAGAVQAYRPEEGFCAAEAVAASDVEAITTIADAVAVSGGSVVAGNESAVTLLR